MTLFDLDNFETDIGIHLPYVIKLTLKIHRHMNAKAPFLATFYQRQYWKGIPRPRNWRGCLDFTATCMCSSGNDSRKSIASEFKVKRPFLYPILQLVKRLNKVLVVHVHDHNTGKAAKEFISLLQELDRCNHPIHHNCFTGMSLSLGGRLKLFPIAYLALGQSCFKNQVLLLLCTFSD